MRLMQWLATLIHKPHPSVPVGPLDDDPEEDQLIHKVREEIDAARRVLMQAEAFRRHERQRDRR